MEFDTGKDAPEYEAFEAALEIAERETVAAMLRISETYQGERRKEPSRANDPEAAPARSK